MQAGLGVEAELVGMFSVLCRGTDACSQRVCKVPPQPRLQSPRPALSSDSRNFTGCNSFATLCFTSPAAARPSLSFSYGIFSSQPCKCWARLLCFGESCSLRSAGSGRSPRHGRVACRSGLGKDRALPAPGQSPVAQGKGKRPAQLIQTRQRGREGSKGGWFEAEQCLG